MTTGSGLGQSRVKHQHEWIWITTGAHPHGTGKAAGASKFPGKNYSLFLKIYQVIRHYALPSPGLLVLEWVLTLLVFDLPLSPVLVLFLKDQSYQHYSASY